ncbi:MAG: bifunctional DNA-formamidopyrimidine glycosylase/DNA-(apurinic or apyrimidinic site) lyase [Bryobacteraceae bacterium]|nr:bifunctional DNA-formamidopyrimidine glycosylase/DNA-(apurinic or apyrimidinic site) lyase [Bryobacteraceae bacterium]
MPELPEVETIRRTLAPLVTGIKILSMEILSPRAAAPSVASLIAGQTIVALARHGKYLFLDLTRHRLAVHLRMTGKLLVGAPSSHPRAIIHTSGPDIVFDDIRQFGSITCLGKDDLPPNLGPDLLSISPTDFVSALARHSGAIKPVLLNQAIFAGLGNIYADEALFRARIHPRARLAHLSRTRLRALHARTGELLIEAIGCGGSSISDYVDASGSRGTFQLRHQVYARAGHPCPVCSTPIRRIVVAQRGTHFCPRCQRP